LIGDAHDFFSACLILKWTGLTAWVQRCDITGGDSDLQAWLDWPPALTKTQRAGFVCADGNGLNLLYLLA
jgi:hypothetical protein